MPSDIIINDSELFTIESRNSVRTNAALQRALARVYQQPRMVRCLCNYHIGADIFLEVRKNEDITFRLDCIRAADLHPRDVCEVVGQEYEEPPDPLDFRKLFSGQTIDDVGFRRQARRLVSKSYFDALEASVLEGAAFWPSFQRSLGNWFVRYASATQNTFCEGAKARGQRLFVGFVRHDSLMTAAITGHLLFEDWLAAPGLRENRGVRVGLPQLENAFRAVRVGGEIVEADHFVATLCAESGVVTAIMFLPFVRCDETGSPVGSTNEARRAYQVMQSPMRDRFFGVLRLDDANEFLQKCLKPGFKQWTPLRYRCDFIYLLDQCFLLEEVRGYKLHARPQYDSLMKVKKEEGHRLQPGYCFDYQEVGPMPLDLSTSTPDILNMPGLSMSTDVSALDALSTSLLKGEFILRDQKPGTPWSRSLVPKF